MAIVLNRAANFKAGLQKSGIDVATVDDVANMMGGKLIASTYPLLESFSCPASTNNALINGFLLGGWWWCPKTMTIDKLGYRIGAVNGSAGAVTRVGLYGLDSTGGPSGAPVAEVNGLSGTAGTNTSVSGNLGANVQLAARTWYATVVELQGSPSTVPQVYGFTAVMPGVIPFATSSTPSFTTGWNIAGSASTGTGLPTITAGTAAATSGFRPGVWAHIVSVP